MRIEIRELKTKVDSISDNIKVYLHDLDKMKKKLVELGVEDFNSVNDQIAEIKEKNNKLIKREQAFLKKADKIISRMEE